MSRYRQYPTYQSTGVAWLSRIPGDWKYLSLSRVTKSRCDGPFGSGLKSEHYASSGVRVIRLQNIGEARFRGDDAAFIRNDYYEHELGDHSVRTGDLLIAGLGDSNNHVGRACVAPSEIEPAMVKADCFRFRLVQDLAHPAYVAYQLTSTAAAAAMSATGATRSRLNLTATSNRQLALPPLPEQISIVNFLDRETTKIDTLIQKKQRLIELLNEKRAALISHAVTKGLDPGAPMRASGVEWIGDVPAHWKMKELRYLTQRSRPIMYGIVLPGPDVKDGVPIVKGGNCEPGRLSLEQLAKTTYEIESKYVRSRLLGGDIVIAIRGSVGGAQLVPDELTGANMTQDAARISPQPVVDRLWLLYAVRARAVFAQLDAGAMGATIRGINIRDLKRASIPVPPIEEQQVIAKHVLAAENQIGQVADQVLKAIERLQEYRAALISAAVTGQIDVRNEV